MDNTTPITPAELQKLKALCDAALQKAEFICKMYGELCLRVAGGLPDFFGTTQNTIREARTAMPRLIAQVEQDKAKWDDLTNEKCGCGDTGYPSCHETLPAVQAEVRKLAQQAHEDKATIERQSAIIADLLATISYCMWQPDVKNLGASYTSPGQAAKLIIAKYSPVCDTCGGSNEVWQEREEFTGELDSDGKEVSKTVAGMVICPNCTGGKVKCGTCGDEGNVIRMKEPTPTGISRSVSETCPDCQPKCEQPTSAELKDLNAQQEWGTDYADEGGG